MPQRFILAPARPDLAARVPRRGFLARLLGVVGGGALLSRAGDAAAPPGSVQGGSPFIGEIAMIGFSFAPAGWALCDGQLLPIAENEALFSLIGTTYGGDGQTTFALPNLNGRAPIHQGQRPGGSSHVLGDAAGVEVVTLVESQLPAHPHGARADSELGTSDSPDGRYPAKSAAGMQTYKDDPSMFLGYEATQPAGFNQAHDNMQPYLTVNFIISLYGIYPSQ